MLGTNFKWVAGIDVFKPFRYHKKSTTCRTGRWRRGK